MSLKRQRANEGQNLLESFGALLRQSTSRAMERLRLQIYGRDGADRDRGVGRGYSNYGSNKNHSGRTVRPIDRLIIVFALYYFSVSDLVPAHHFLVLAQDLITKSEERVRRASQSFFEPISTSLALFCETLVEEYVSDDVEDALNEMEEFVMIRERIGEYIVESSGVGDFVDDDNADDEDDNADEHPNASGGYGSSDSGRGSSALLGRIYKNLEFFVHIRVFIHALSRDAAANVSQQQQQRRGGNNTKKKEDPSLTFQPRYEHQMLKLLVQAVSGKPLVKNSDPSRSASPSPVNQSVREDETDTQTRVKMEGEEDEEVPQLQLDQIVPLEAIQVDSPPLTRTRRKKHISFEVKEESKMEEEEAVAAAMGTVVEGGRGSADDDNSDDDEEEIEENNDQKRVKKEETKAKQEDKKQDEEGEEARIANEVRQATATALLADLLALSHVPSSSDGGGKASPAEPAKQERGKGPSFSQVALHKIRGVHAPYYQLLHARLGVMVTRQKLHHFEKYNTIHTPPPLTTAQEEVVTREAAAMQLLQQQLQQYGTVAGGVPLNFVPDQAYYQRVLGIAHGNEAVVEDGQTADSGTTATAAVRGLGEDEELFTGEIMDYYMRRRPIASIQDKAAQIQQVQSGNDRRGARNRNNNNDTNKPGSPTNSPQDMVLVKPHRACTIKTGFTWTQYNRTHYDSRTNPPPKSVMWYDFTLFYPALANTKRDPRKFFRLEDTPQGPNDEYCLLVFSVGPPYADVAYRIERKQWDRRRGGLRISFDANGTFRLFFRFSNSNYRR